MTVGSLLRGGFGVIRGQPGAVAIWAALFLVVNIVAILLLMPTMSAIVATPTPDLAALQSAPGWISLYDIVALVLGVAVYAAAFRSVLFAHSPGFAFLRLGIDEFLLAALFIVLGIIGAIIMVVAILLLSIVVAGLAFGLGSVGAIAVASLGGIALGCALIWAEVRISLCFPLTVMRGQLVIGDGWRLSRGHFWTLFGAYLVVFVILLAVVLLFFVPVYGGYIMDITRAGSDQHKMNLATQMQFARLLDPRAANIVLLVVAAVVNALTVALVGGVAATAVKELDVVARTSPTGV